MTKHKRFIVPVILLLAWAAPSWALDRTVMNDLSPRMRRLAEQEQAILEQQNLFFDDATVNDFLVQVAGRLWKQLETDLKSPTVKIVMDPLPNAQAYPNGLCLMTTGMLSHLESEEQLAMILSHEMIHYARQHTPLLYEKLKTGTRDLDPTDPRFHPRSTDNFAAATIDALEKQADREGLALFEEAGYCLSILLEQVSNLEDQSHGNGSSEVLKDLRARIRKMRPHGGVKDKEKCQKPMGGSNQGIFLARIAPVLLANAQVALARGEYQQADRSVSMYLALVPDDARANFIKGEILNRANAVKKEDSGLSFYEKALTLDPNFPLAHRALGVLHFRAGRYKRAIPYFESFLALAPDDPSHLFIQGYLRECQK